jgi:hypothetical protein
MSVDISHPVAKRMDKFTNYLQLFKKNRAHAALFTSMEES